MWYGHCSNTKSASTVIQKQLERALRLPVSGKPIREPQCHHSLSHSGTWIWGISRKSGIGTGIDIECWRSLNMAHQRLILTMEEQRQAKNRSLSSETLLRLWTIKEACFKADTYRHSGWVTQYHVDNIFTQQGLARITSDYRTRSFRYISLPRPYGILSIAIREE